MQLEVGELAEPEQRRQVVADDVLLIALVVAGVERDEVDELRRLVGDVLLIEVRLADAVRVSHER